MRRAIFYAHAGSGNHGCEAIVRSSLNVIQESVVLYSMNQEQDIKYGLGDILGELRIDQDEDPVRYSIPWFTSRIQTKFTGSIEKTIYYRKKKMIDEVRPGDVWFSIGGDNYCYSGTDVLAAENKLIRKHGAKTVLWGCSVEPELLAQPDVAKDLSSYDLITARESISYEALCTINPNTVLVADPAFTLPKKELQLPNNWQTGNMIGINASPLILQNAQNSTQVFLAYQRLVEYILEKTEYGIVFVPHVVWKHNDDRVPLRKLYDQYVNTGRVVMIDDCNCMELKGYIARCRLFVGARTHATIAAYSSCVPTLVLGYSVKSKGIARDLFGTDKFYVLPVQELQSEDALVEGLQWLISNEKMIKSHLETTMPEYINKAYDGKKAVEKL